MEYIHHFKSPLGGITMSSDGEALTGLWFDGQKYFAATLSENFKEELLPVFELTDKWLKIFFGGAIPCFTPPLIVKSTPFRKSVCEIMLSIPYGGTMTYGEIAKKIAKEKGTAKMSSRAIGGAVGHNPISLIIPCHRVIGADGSLTGYAGGIERKIRLLSLEKASICKDQGVPDINPFLY